MITDRVGHRGFYRTGLILASAIALLSAAVLSPSSVSLFLALFAGIPILALSGKRWSPVAFVCAAIILSLPIWSTSFLIAAAIGSRAVTPYIPPLIAGLCLVISLLLPGKHLKLNRMTYADYLALGIAVMLAVPLLFTFWNNGIQDTSLGKYYFMYPRAELDFSYHFGLIQQALNRSSIPYENPLFADVPNHYPSFIHTGLAGLATLQHGPAAVTLWHILPVLMLASGTMGFLAVSAIAGCHAIRGCVVLAFAYAAFALIRVDYFLIFQIHPLAFGLLSLLILYSPRGDHKSWLQWTIYTAIAILLVLSHTVTATVAVILTAAQFLFIIIRRKKRQLIPCFTAGILIVVSFALVNHYPHIAPIKDSITTEYLKQYFTVLVLPYLVPILLCFAFLFCQRTVTPLAMAGFALIMLTICYWAFGFSENSHKKIFFALFNAPRFAILGLFLLLPYLNYRRIAGYALPGLLVLSLLIYPNQVLRNLPDQFTETALNYPLKDVQMMNTVLDDMTTGSILSNYTDLGPAAFSGCPIYIEEPSFALYALDTVDEHIANQRLADRTAFFGSFSAEERLAYMNRHGIGALVVSGDLVTAPPNKLLPDGSFAFNRGDRWAIYKLVSPGP